MIGPNSCPSPPGKRSELGRHPLKLLRSQSKAGVLYLFNVTSYLVSPSWCLVPSQYPSHLVMLFQCPFISLYFVSLSSQGRFNSANILLTIHLDIYPWTVCFALVDWNLFASVRIVLLYQTCLSMLLKVLIFHFPFH